MKIYALHGNLGLPQDWNGVERHLGRPLEKVHLWQSDVAPFERWAQQFVETTVSGSVLIGYSLGGRLALHALLANPEHFRAAIILSSHPGLASAEERQSRLANDQQWAEKCRTGPWEAFLGEWNAQSVFGQTNALESSQQCETWREQIAIAFDVWSLGRQEPLTTRLTAVAGKVHWLTGALDTKFTAIAQQICQQTGIQHETVPAAGHRILADRPDAVAQSLAEFADSR